MANYEKIKEISQSFDIVSGTLHPECIYLIAEEHFDPNIHGDEYEDEWGFVGKLHIYLYKPLIKDKYNDWQGKFYTGAESMRRIATSPKKNIAFLGCISKGTIISQKTPKEDTESFQLTKNGIQARGNITDLVVIDNEIYASSSGGAIYRRITDDDWEEIALSVTEPFFSDDNFPSGFTSIGGFSADEIYAGGEKGILWLRDKGMWRPVDLPFNKEVEQIICAPDGNVYLNCRWCVLKGRRDTWEIINVKEDISMPLNKMAWFKRKLYLLPDAASAIGMFCYDANNIKKVPVGVIQINPKGQETGNPLLNLEFKNEENQVFIPGGLNDMIASDDLLMITGNSTVILFNGERWFNLFDKNRTEEELRATGTFYDPREL